MVFNLNEINNDDVNVRGCLYDILLEAGKFYDMYLDTIESLPTLVPFDPDNLAVTLENLYAPCSYSCSVIRTNVKKLISSAEYSVLHGKSIFQCIDYLIKVIVKENGLSGISMICDMVVRVAGSSIDFYVDHIFNCCAESFNAVATDSQFKIVEDLYEQMVKVDSRERITELVTRFYHGGEDFSNLKRALRDITEDYVGVWVVSGYVSNVDTLSIVKYVNCVNYANKKGNLSDILPELTISSFGIYNGLKLLVNTTDKDIELLESNGISYESLDILSSFKNKYRETPDLLMSIMSVKFDYVKSDQVCDYEDVSEFIMLEALVYAINNDESDSRDKDYLACITYLCVLYNIKFGILINRLNSDIKKERFIKDLSDIIDHVCYNK